jgi:RHS repeat-associated protein
LNDTYCKEVHKTLYDVPDPQLQNKLAACNINPGQYLQTFVAGNVSKTWTEKPNTTTTWYSYDVLGRVKWIVQEIPGLDCLKTIDYTYDPETGQVTQVDYQRHLPSEWFVHRYGYNDAGQLVSVHAGAPAQTGMKHQATYTYNESGQLVRTVLGDNLQGIDYVYNLNGQLKAINHPSLLTANDPGRDGTGGSHTPADVFGMALDYYNGDYARKNTPTPVAERNTTGTNQYNGNIKGMRFRTQGLSHNGQFNTYNYAYNKNSWLESASFGWGSLSPISGQRHRVNFTANPQGDYRVSGISYDPNGNLMTLSRNGYTGGGTNAMDEFVYHYRSNNQLRYVTDTGDNPDPTRYDDLRDQPQNNYVYNARGELVKNIREGLEYDYYTTGLVREVRKNGVPLVRFFYNDRGQRVRKQSFDQNGHPLQSIFYVRDAAGSVMAIYHKGQNGLIRLNEHPVYGLARLGVYYRTVGKYAYQLTDHLGNVRAVVVDAGGTAVSITSKTDYYPFGMAMPGRHVDGGYRYAFQGQEKDGETGMEAFELRLWDSRIGRWLTVDPYGQYYSPYLGMGNNPISAIDVDGGYVYLYGKRITKNDLRTILGTSIGRYSLMKYINNPHHHIHIAATSIKPPGGYQGELFPISILANKKTFLSKKRLRSLSNKLSERLINTFGDIYTMQKGKNDMMIIYIDYLSQPAHLTVFHEYYAHVYLRDEKGAKGVLNQHMQFAGTPSGTTQFRIAPVVIGGGKAKPFDYPIDEYLNQIGTKGFMINYQNNILNLINIGNSIFKLDYQISPKTKTCMCPRN